MRVFTCLVVLLSVLLLPALSQDQISDSPSDLSELKARFQNILNEIGGDDNTQSNSNAYESSVANLLSKVDNLQRSSDISQNISLDWYLQGGESTSAPNNNWMATPMRVVLVVSSFEGMYLNSGIGTFYAALSDFLVHQGHSVTILYTRADNSDEKLTFQRWKSSFEKRGVKVVRLEAPKVKLTQISQIGQKSFQVYRYLKDHQVDFDVVHFPEFEGPGYYSTLAKHEGLAFDEKILIVGLHGPWRWVKSGNFKGEKGMLSTADDFETDWMERKSVEYADTVWTPSLDLVQWLSAQGWAFPCYEKKSLFLMPFLPGREISRDFAKSKSSSVAPGAASSATTELVFFGRLEKRKGLELFADALDKLAMRRPEFQQDLKITFMGRSTNIGGQSATNWIEQRSSAWPFRVSTITHKDRKGALEYLRADKGRVAVMPSLIENAPYTVYECLFLGIPFIATNLPSIAALVHADDRSRALTTMDSLALSNKLEAILDVGAVPIKSSFNTEKVSDSWIGFYDRISTQLKAIKAKSEESQDDFRPLVSVCITHYNRPEMLQLAIDSISAQTYKNFEVILVDDGSTVPAAIAFVDSLKPSFTAKGWKIVKTRNQYLGAARNTASKMARGEFLLFLDDDNLAKPEQLSTYVSVAGFTGSDILTAAHDVFRGNALPDETPQTTNILSRSIPVGPSAPLGIFKNCFGDANFFIRKSSFMQVGGFTEERGVGQEDHEFLAKAVLEGHHLLAIPEVLLYYRMHNRTDQMIYNTDPIKNHLRAKRPYEGVSQSSSSASSSSSSDKGEGMDLLKIIAYENQRASRDVRNLMAICNTTVHSVDPDRMPSLAITKLVFTVSNLDCHIESINIGSYECANPVVASATSVECDSPSIAIPDNYPITFTYTPEPDNAVDTGLHLEVYSVSNPDFTTRSILALKMKTDPQSFSETVLLNRLAGIGGVEPNTLAMQSDMVTPGAKRAFTDTRSMRIVVTSTSKTDPASSVVKRIIAGLTANPGLLSDIGQLVDFAWIADCDGSGGCECTANYEGAGCETPASCPGNCSGHGACQDGRYSRVCLCDAGYTGKDCSSGMCSSQCSLHGTCILTPGQNGTCSCNTGWTGADCTIAAACPGTPSCSGRGTCSQGQCVCDAGFSGAACDVGSSTTLSLQAGGKKSNNRKGVIAFAVVIPIVGIALIILGSVAIYRYYRRHRREAQYL